MSTEKNQLIGQALSLDETDRRELLDCLRNSLPDDIDPTIEAAWIVEAEHRIDLVDRGESTPLDGETVLAELEREWASKSKASA